VTELQHCKGPGHVVISHTTPRPTDLQPGALAAVYDPAYHCLQHPTYGEPVIVVNAAGTNRPGLHLLPTLWVTIPESLKANALSFPAESIVIEHTVLGSIVGWHTLTNAAALALADTITAAIPASAA
jgi:hypothetical protein